MSMDVQAPKEAHGWSKQRDAQLKQELQTHGWEPGQPGSATMWQSILETLNQQVRLHPACNTAATGRSEGMLQQSQRLCRRMNRSVHTWVPCGRRASCSLDPWGFCLRTFLHYRSPNSDLIASCKHTHAACGSHNFFSKNLRTFR